MSTHASAPGSAISLYARATEGFEARVAHTLALLREAATLHAGRIVQATSLGAEDMVLTDLIARHRLPVAVGTLETGKLHPETTALIERIEAHYGLALEVYRPVDAAVLHFVRSHGEDGMRRSIELRKACCGLRKLEPLSRMLHGRDAWVTGLRREQSDTRGGVPFLAHDEFGRSKLNPLADWSWADVWHHLALHGVPTNPLHDRFMPSIGCRPCTREIAVGEPFRSGRWWWEDESAKECGLHAPAPCSATAPTQSQTPSTIGALR